MLRILGITMWIFVSSVVMGQSTNPFDLKYRKAAPPSVVSVVPKPTPVDTVRVITTPDTSTTNVKGHVPAEDENLKLQKKDTLPSASASNPFELNAKIDTSPSLAIVDTSKTKPSASQESKGIKPILPGKSSKGFQIFFILLSLLFLIFIVNVERSFVRDLWRVISNQNYSSLHHRNQRNTMRQILLLMGYAVFTFQTGIFLFNSLRILGIPGFPGASIWYALGFVAGIYLVRHAIIRYLRWLFTLGKELTLFSFDITIFNIMVGLILLPINIMLLFGPDSMFKPLVIIGIASVVLAYFMRQLRWTLGVQSLITRSLFLFFIYLCAVEILPLWAVSTIFW